LGSDITQLEIFVQSGSLGKSVPNYGPWLQVSR